MSKYHASSHGHQPKPALQLRHLGFICEASFLQRIFSSPSERESSGIATITDYLGACGTQMLASSFASSMLLAPASCVVIGSLALSASLFRFLHGNSMLSLYVA